MSYARNPGWRAEATDTLDDLLFGHEERESIDFDKIRFRHLEDLGDANQFEIEFEAEPGVNAVGRLFVPKSARNAPLMLILQGHVEGMHVSWGEGPEKWGSTGHHHVQQCLEQGFAAFALEQRGFGRRRDQRLKEQARYGGRCHNAAMVAQLHGRTLIGERVRDAQVALDAIAYLRNNLDGDAFPRLDLARVASMGNSAGGTVTIYASIFDERIKAAMPSGSLCQFDRSIGIIDHCVCNFIPGIRRYFEMGDIGALIAPKPLVVVHGVEDAIFPIAGTREAMDTIRRAYADAGVPDMCALVEGPHGHEFYPELAWPLFRRLTGW